MSIICFWDDKYEVHNKCSRINFNISLVYEELDVDFGGVLLLYSA